MIEDVQFTLFSFLVSKCDGIQPLVTGYLDLLVDSDDPSRNAFPIDVDLAFLNALPPIEKQGALAAWSGQAQQLCISDGGESEIRLSSSIEIGIPTRSVALAALVAPVAFTLGLKVLVAMRQWSLPNASWEGVLASRISKTVVGFELLQKLERATDVFWQNTQTAFVSATAHVEQEQEERQHWTQTIMERADAATKMSEGINAIN